MTKIIPHLWFDKNAKESAEFYVSIFPDAKITKQSLIKGTPSGNCDVMSFALAGVPFMSISAGPHFTINPSVSFMVNFDPSRDVAAKDHLTLMWEKLMSGGKALMPLSEYPFSKWYGWVEDKYGVSWQLILTNPHGEERPFIMPALLFVGAVDGKAEEAVDFYLSVFRDAQLGQRVKYPSDMGPSKAGTVMFSDFRLWETWMTAMDGGSVHNFSFNEGVSFVVNCRDQEEIDYFWGKLSAVPSAEQCGWLKDKFGVSWQIVPTCLGDMMATGTAEQNKRVTEAFLSMKKFNIKILEDAFAGK
jgi:predicted 3-demethylubiquinone-9 3-methyltransferase (glyoxalase superfamily)